MVQDQLLLDPRTIWSWTINNLEEYSKSNMPLQPPGALFECTLLQELICYMLQYKWWQLLWHSHHQSSRIHQWWSYVCVRAVRCGDHRDYLEFHMNFVYLACGDPSSINIVSKCFQRSHYMIFCEILPEHGICKVTFNAHSSNNGYMPTFIFCRASIKQWQSKRIIGPFYSNLGWNYGLLTNKLMHTLKDSMKSVIILF